MDKINKNLLKIPLKQRSQVERVVEQIVNNRLEGLDSKKIKGTSNVYRVRVGNYRIIFAKEARQNIVSMINKRDEKTYKDY